MAANTNDVFGDLAIPNYVVCRTKPGDVTYGLGSTLPKTRTSFMMHSGSHFLW